MSDMGRETRDERRPEDRRQAERESMRTNPEVMGRTEPVRGEDQHPRESEQPRTEETMAGTDRPMEQMDIWPQMGDFRRRSTVSTAIWIRFASRSAHGNSSARTAIPAAITSSPGPGRTSSAMPTQRSTNPTTATTTRRTCGWERRWSARALSIKPSSGTATDAGYRNLCGARPEVAANVPRARLKTGAQASQSLWPMIGLILR